MKKMKTKTKTIALVEVAVLLCSMLLVATLPAIATAASEDNSHPLGIYGNANEDDTIDMRDTTYIKLAIFGKKPETDLADANHDGKVSMLDVGQTKLIILGKEKTLTFVDFDGVIETIHKPLDRIVTMAGYHAQACRIVGAKDRVVGVVPSIGIRPTFFPDLSKLPCVGKANEPDIETMLELKPDVVIMYTRAWTPELEAQIEDVGIEAIVLMPRNPDTIRGEMMKFGYLFDGVENARNYVEWYVDIENTILGHISGIPEDEKPRVFMEDKHGTGTMTERRISGHIMECEQAGGIDIGADLLGAGQSLVEVEWIIEQNPDVILGSESGEAALTSYETDDISNIKAYYEEIIGLPGFENIDAVKNGRVHIINNELTRSCANLVGTAYLAKWFYPDISLNPVEIHQKYMDEFCGGLDFDVSEHGVFVYPKPAW